MRREAIFVVFLCQLFLASATLANPTALRKKIFTKQPDQPSCRVVSRGLSSEMKRHDAAVEQRIAAIVEALSRRDDAKLKTFFHPRLRIKTKDLKAVFRQLRFTFREPTLSVYRIWALNTVDGTAKPLPCFDDKLALQPHHGYPLQFGVWIQAMGKKELGRIYLSLIPNQSEWRIGVFHIQQWTHQGKDAEAWISEALDNSAKGLKFTAYVKLDIARKLLRGGGYVYMKLRDDVETTQAAYYPNDSWYQSVVSLLERHKIVYAGTLLAKDGAGLLLRVQVSGKEKGPRLQRECLAMGKRLAEKAPTTGLGGLRCGYIVKGEDPTKAGFMGSRFVSREKIRSFQGQK